MVHTLSVQVTFSFAWLLLSNTFHSSVMVAQTGEKLHSLIKSFARFLGGHTKAASYTTFIFNAEALGLGEAVKIARLEYNNIKQVHEFAKRHNIPCENREID